jgi:putative oxidoreductase
MRIASLIARYLLGLLFVIFGANGFLQFIHMPPPTGLAGQFMGAIFMSHYYVAIFLLQLVGGLLLLAGRYVPLALVLLGPVIVNIFLFHVFLAPAGLPMATVVVILWLLTFAGVRSAFAGIFQAKA